MRESHVFMTLPHGIIPITITRSDRGGMFPSLCELVPRTGVMPKAPRGPRRAIHAHASGMLVARPRFPMATGHVLGRTSSHGLRGVISLLLSHLKPNSFYSPWTLKRIPAIRVYSLALAAIEPMHTTTLLQGLLEPPMSFFVDRANAFTRLLWSD